MINTSTTLFILFIIVPILALVLLGLNLLFAPHKPYEEKVSAYESGFSAIHGQTRNIFHIHFWIVALLFSIFDIELILLFPLTVSLHKVSIFGFIVAMVFFLLLTIGFVLEYRSGAISMKQDKDKSVNPFIFIQLFYILLFKLLLKQGLILNKLMYLLYNFSYWLYNFSYWLLLKLVLKVKYIMFERQMNLYLFVFTCIEFVIIV